MASEAEQELDRLIGVVLAEHGILGEGEVLGDYLVMAEVADFTEAGRGYTKYANIIPGDTGYPLHRVLGLIKVCRKKVLEEQQAPDE